MYLHWRNPECGDSGEGLEDVAEDVDQGDPEDCPEMRRWFLSR